MKNPTILKDELSLLRADKSAVLIELRKGGIELRDVRNEISKEEAKLDEVKKEILDETARLEDTRGRAVSVKGELGVSTQELKNINNSLDIAKTKNAQETRLHLGRIKDLKEEESSILVEVSRLKSIFDANSKVYNERQSERESKLRSLDTSILESEKELKQITSRNIKFKEEEKKLTKERLKREDKLRAREKYQDARELSMEKREEDLITMSKDMTIVYGRIKELYSQTHPDVDLDKLILQAI